MQPFGIVLLVIAVLLIVSQRKRKKAKQQELEASFKPIVVGVQGDHWTCTAEELLENLEPMQLDSGFRALTIYVFGRGYVPRGKSHLLTMETNDDGRVTRILFDWCMEDHKELRKSVLNYLILLLSVMAKADQKRIADRINDMILHHKKGVKDEATLLAEICRLSITVDDKHERHVTVELVPTTEEERTEYQAQKALEPVPAVQEQTGDKGETKE